MVLPAITWSSAHEPARPVRPDHDPAAGQSLADVVVGVAGKVSVTPARQERAERLAGGAGQADVMVSSGRPSGPNRRVTSEPSMVPAVRSTLRIGSSSRTRWASSRAPSASWISLGPGPCRDRVPDPPRSLATSGIVSSTVKIAADPARAALQCATAVAMSQQLGVPDRLVDRPEAKRRQDIRGPARPGTGRSLDELRGAGVPLAQHRVLGGDADRAGVQVADPHHHAAGDHQRRGGEAELLGAEQRGDDHVAAGLQPAVDLHLDAVAQPVEPQRLLGLGQAELPRAARRA